MSSSNGHHANGASAPESRHDRIVRELREELTDREVVLAALQAQIDAEKSEVVRLRRAVAALDPDPEPPAPTKPPAKSSGGRRSTKTWTPSAETVERVLAGLIEVGEPIGPTNLAKRLDGASFETVARSLKILRDDGRIRVAGKTRGGGKAYLPMPEELAATGAAS